MPILEIENLQKSFDGQKVLRGISLSLEKGDVVALIGPSGNGKTTLLRCINFLETPDGGSITVNGEKIFDAAKAVRQSEAEIRKKRLHFGMVFQNFNLFPQYTALQNVALAKELLEKERAGKSLSAREIKAGAEKEARALLAQVGLSDKADYYPHQLSGGQQQRVAIARALALRPDILCFDEPTSALDPELTGEVLRVIKSLADGSTTMIIVTHEMAFARDVASKIVFIENGEIAEEGTPEKIFEHPDNRRVAEFIRG